MRDGITTKSEDLVSSLGRYHQKWRSVLLATATFLTSGTLDASL